MYRPVRLAAVFCQQGHDTVAKGRLQNPRTTTLTQTKSKPSENVRSRWLTAFGEFSSLGRKNIKLCISKKADGGHLGRLLNIFKLTESNRKLLARNLDTIKPKRIMEIVFKLFCQNLKRTRSPLFLLIFYDVKQILIKPK